MTDVCRPATGRFVQSGGLALYKHFSEAAVGVLLDSKERSTFSGFATKLQSRLRYFLHSLALMYDALEELADLSESLQADSTTLPNADRYTE